MTLLRILWRVPASIVVTAYFAAIPPIGRWFLAGNESARARLGARSCQGWGRAMCAILGVERQVRGSIPSEDVFLVAANHLSYLDILVLGSLYPSLFVAKREIASWPLFGWVARGAGTLFVDRDQARDVVRAGRQIREHLTLGVPLTIFPEGRSTPGSAILPFLPSLLEPAAQTGVPCYAASLRYETPGCAVAPSVTVCWYDSRSFPSHFVGLAKLPRIVAHINFAETPVRSSDRKELARTLWETANQSFEPVRQA